MNAQANRAWTRGDLQRASQICSALADPSRLHTLILLDRPEEMSVTEVAAALKMPLSNASRNLGMLARAGLLVQRRAGQHRYYFATEEAVRLLEELHDVVTPPTDEELALIVD